MKKLSALVLIMYETINSFIEMTVDSIADELFPILDKIVFLTTDSFGYSSKGELTGKLGEIAEFILILANALIVAIVLWYVFQQVFAYFFSFEIESPWKFIIRLIFFSILMNTAFFISHQLIYLVEQITEFLSSAITNKVQTISFQEFTDMIGKTIEIEDEESFNIFSIEGLINTYVYFGIFYLGIMYSVRYIMLRFLVLLSPVAFMMLISKTTGGIFKGWFQLFMGLLLSQVFIVIVLAIPFVLELGKDTQSKLLLTGVLFTLYKVNDLVNVLVGRDSLMGEIKVFGASMGVTKSDSN